MEKKIYSIENTKGMKACIMNYGANLQALYVPNKKGEIKDVVLGYSNLDSYEENDAFFGCTVGPIANRTENATYKIDGDIYNLDKNNDVNNLHSHFEKGYHKCFFDITEEKSKLICTLISKEDDVPGSPGNKEITVTYEITEDNELSISYKVTSDKDTWINMTNHSYFNLRGHDAGKIEDHMVQIFSDKITEVRDGSIPTGRLIDVENTPMDFRKETRIFDRIEDDYDQLKITGGYDHNYVLRDLNAGIRKVAILSDKKSGRQMEVYTDLPGVQLYAGNFISDLTGKDGARYSKRHGVCFETQYYPNAINVESFPSPLTTPKKPFESTTIYKFC